MSPPEFFRHCPRCGAAAGPVSPAPNPFHCGACGFRYFFNPTVAVAVFARREDGRTLLIRRARDPGKGRLAPPGGFIDVGETAETAAIRELREEVGLEIGDLGFLCSEPNQYTYEGVTYPVLDFFFTARCAGTEIPAIDEVAAAEWFDPQEIEPGALAFPSMQCALVRWQKNLRTGR